jgi:hypothetical protein
MLLAETLNEQLPGAVNAEAPALSVGFSGKEAERVMTRFDP